MAIPEPVSSDSEPNKAGKKAVSEKKNLSIIDVIFYYALPAVAGCLMIPFAMSGNFQLRYVVIFAPLAVFLIGLVLVKPGADKSARLPNGMKYGNALASRFIAVVVVSVLLFVVLGVVFLIQELHPTLDEFAGAVTGNYILDKHLDIGPGEWGNILLLWIKVGFLTMSAPFGLIGLVRTTLYRRTAPVVRLSKPVRGSEKYYTHTARYYRQRVTVKTAKLLDNPVFGVIVALVCSVIGLCFLAGLTMSYNAYML